MPKAQPQFDTGDLVRTTKNKTVWRVENTYFDDSTGQWEYTGRAILGGMLFCAFESSIELAPEASNVVVTDHALVRYLGRVLDVDVEAIRRAILSERIEKCINTLGSGKYPVTPGFCAIVINNTVVTIRPSK